MDITNLSDAEFKTLSKDLNSIKKVHSETKDARPFHAISAFANMMNIPKTRQDFL